MTAIFVTATGTDIGKTFVTAALIRHMRASGHIVEALKPVVTGFDPTMAADSDPGVLLTLVNRRVKAPRDRVLAALQGRVTDRHRFLLRLHLQQFDHLDAAILDIDQEVDRDLDPFREAVRLLRTIPGVSSLSAQVIVSEIGADMSRFPIAGHLVSWAGLCPRND